MKSCLNYLAVYVVLHKNDIARHTFDTTVTLSTGVSIESVSKMLGHIKNLSVCISHSIPDST